VHSSIELLDLVRQYTLVELWAVFLPKLKNNE
jgi:hypothetical protein